MRAYETVTPAQERGHAGLRRSFGGDAGWFEYRLANKIGAPGHYLVMVGALGSFGSNLTIRIHHEAEFRADGLSLKSPVECGFTFEDLWRAFTEACTSFGYAPSDKESCRRFFDETRGYGVLWAQLQQGAA